MFNGFRRYFSTDLAIDLGTANTLICTRDKGIAGHGAEAKVGCVSACKIDPLRRGIGVQF